MSMDELREKMRRKGLPTRVVMRDLNRRQLLEMSDPELRRVSEAERAKLMLAKKQINEVWADLSRELSEIGKEKRKLVSEMTSLEMGEMTPQVIKRARELTDKMARLHERSDTLRKKAEERVFKLQNDVDRIEMNINRIDQVWGRR